MPFEVSDERGTTRVRIRGRWTVAEAAQHQRTGHALGGREIAFDASGLEAIDLSGALQLWRAEQDVVMAGGHARWTPSRPELLEFLDRTMQGEKGAPTPVPAAGPDGIAAALHGVGRSVVRAREGTLDLLGFIGAVAVCAGAIAGSIKRLRLPSVVRHVYETGITAVPIVSLIAFLIAVIVAYIGAQQLRKFGGEIFVVDLVTVSVLRELGVLLTAIIIAGRSGSAFAAEIGAMKLNDEVDALRAMVARTNAARPDLVVLLGDYVIHGVVGGRFVPPEPTAAVLRGESDATDEAAAGDGGSGDDDDGPPVALLAAGGAAVVAGVAGAAAVRHRRRVTPGTGGSNGDDS